MVNWWKQSTFYEIYMPSFKDGNGDGIGDFAGITSKLDYLKELGIDGLWLTPFYPSPKVDNGYDISEYKSIDPDYGTMEDFEVFIKEAHQRGIRVIADLVLNHTSTDHKWFQESKATKNHPKREWYIWRDEPNNWESFFGGSAWEYNEVTNQYYYHAFAKEQADLNWANPEVKQAMFDVMKFWLEKGVDGFRLDVINFLKVNDSFKDNPYDHEKNEQNHLYDKDQEGILRIITEIAKFVHQFPDKFLVGEVGSEDLKILKQYSGLNKLDVVFNFNIGSIGEFDSDKIFQQLEETEQVYHPAQIPTLFFSSHDISRHISRFGGDEDRAKLVAALMLTAKGVPFIYYGNEIGMRDWVADDIVKMKDVQGLMAYELEIQLNQSHEKALAAANEKSRDKSRTPMQWNSHSNIGFSEATPWITIPTHAYKINVENQQSDPNSMLSFYKRLLKLRKVHSSLSLGDYEFLRNENGMIYFVRKDQFEKILVILNFSDQSKSLNIAACFASDIEMLLSSKRTSLESGKVVTILANEAMILKGDIRDEPIK
ncbi:glycoside hydrolase family 13 protein [Metabacillus dongyingensis]|uniref:glycoside hydrolase family 13 protein n=1 Tax=Metabacillus dongyingensis TaxID=2874282 RepID=UPI001FB244DD|nr:alpha-glucosidase [Metabacillus dongyingensis]UNJ81174.1 Trehalose-6-phosphate hydrolase [Metabacillus dongyingensis]